MTGPAPRRKRGLKFLACLLGVLALGALALVVGIEIAASRQWKDMGVRVQTLVTEAAGRDAKRPTVTGEAEPGNAWDDYLKAFDETSARPITFSSSVFKLFLGRAPQAERGPVEREVAALDGALEAMSRGARRAEARPPLRWEGETLLPHSGEGLLRRLAQIAVCKARLLRESGDVGASVRFLLHTAQFTRDGMAGTSSEIEWEGLGALEDVLAELTDLLRSKALKDGELPLLERALQTLDETLPRDGRAILNDAAFQGGVLLRHDPFYAADETYRKPRPILPGWRHAFSMRLFKTDAFSRWHAVAQGHALAGGLSWDAAKNVFDVNVTLLEAPPENPIVNRLPPPSLESNRAREAQLRLLRAAVHFVLRGEVRPLIDPFGPKDAVLLSALESGRLRLWSRGPNGVDDGGSVADRPVNTLGSTTIIGPALGAADDLVLEVER